MTFARWILLAIPGHIWPPSPQRIGAAARSDGAARGARQWVRDDTIVAGHVGVDGRVVARELPDFDIWPLSRQLVDKYVAPDGRDAFFANMQTEHRLLFELVPDVFRAIDMRVYRGKRADREFQAHRSGEP